MAGHELILTSTIKKLQREFTLIIKDIIIIFLIKMSLNFFQKSNSKADPGGGRAKESVPLRLKGNIRQCQANERIAWKGEVALTARYESVYCKT